MAPPIKLRYVDWQKSRDGSVYAYFRDRGRRIRLPTYGTPEFWTQYGQRLEERQPRVRLSPPAGYPPGTWGALTAEFFESEKFIRKAPNTQRIYRQILEPLADAHGNNRVAMLERKHIEKWKAGRADTPAMANMLVKVVKMILSFAVAKDYRTDNPARRIDLYSGGEHRAWTEEECSTFEEFWRPGTMERRAFTLAKYTGQRCGDLAKMSRAHRRDGRIRVVQEKTGADLWIKELNEVAAELSLGEQHLMLLTSPNGSPFSSSYLSRWFAGAIDRAQLPDDCVLHGLRKTAACMLIEAGATHLQAMAVTGHKDLRVFMEYVKDASQKRLADDAMGKVERNAKRTKIAKRHPTMTAKQ